MLENLIRVSPPQGSPSENRLTRTQKDNESKLRDDFKEKMKEAQDRHDDHEQVPKKLSGGNKKKAVKSEEKSESGPDDQASVILDQSMVLNGVVSKEDEVKTADTDTDLLEVEDSKLSHNQNNLVLQQSVKVDDSSLSNNNALDKDTLLHNTISINSDEFKHLNSTETEIMADISLKSNIDGGTLSYGQATDLLSNTQNKSLGTNEAIQSSSAVEFSQLADASVSDLNSKVEDAQYSGQMETQSETSQKSLMQEKIKAALEKDFSNQKIDYGLNSQIVSHDHRNLNSDSDSGQGSYADSSEQHSHDLSGNGQGKEAPAAISSFDHDLSSQISALHLQQQSAQKQVYQSTHVGAKTEASADHTHNGEENIQSIINQAKFLVTQGGGEMTVKMTPEGFGEMQLRVILDQGKINIEMNSHDKNVKKLIEDSLSDLKSSLALHQMSIDHVKINNVDVVNASHQTQLQSNLNGSHSDQQQNQMLNQQFHSQMGSNQGQQNARSQLANEKNDQLQQQKNRRLNDAQGVSQLVKTTPQATKNLRYGLSAYIGASLNRVA